ncbi:MerR family transcriptional regulator [Blastomonas sp.]|uniref:MerR family transcriptional regulator n=1 Tax=Blastomonas sp. TaxID=1909299 RepID=UPI00261A82F8|nr:MerR family transcriptional regulator [Blastomonas sp.]MDM7955941.1 MerR family transcriptional regulator [Blastomonas sp.]
MADSLDIAAVTRLTGLTARALRFYEARGLVQPLRTASGRRHYDAAALERLNLILSLKKAGLTLAQIQRLTANRRIDLHGLITAQLDHLEAQARRISEAQTLLVSVKSRIDRGEPIDAETFCSLIRHEQQDSTTMSQDQWKAVTDRYFTPEQQAEWADRMGALGEDFDQDAYAAEWKALGDDIKAALPMDPSGEAAAGFVQRWFDLLKPFTDVASPAMWTGTMKMYDDMDNWPVQADPGFDTEVWAFMKQATAARMLAGVSLALPKQPG